MLTDEQRKKLRSNPNFKALSSGYKQEYAPAVENIDDKIKARQERAKSMRPGVSVAMEEQKAIAEQKSQDPMRQGVFGKALGTGFDVLKGAAKGVASTVVGMGELGTKLNPFISKESKEKTSEFAQGLREDQLKARGTAEKIGKVIEQVGELFIPVPGLAQAGKVSAGTKLLSKEGIKGAGKFIAKEAVDIGAKTAAQTGGDTEETIKAAIFGGVGGAMSKAVIEPLLKTVPKALATYLEKENLRLTPAQKTNLKNKLPRVVDWLTENRIVGTPEARLNKVDDIYSKTEDTLQGFLKTSDKTVEKAKLMEELNGIKLKYQFDRDVLAIEKQIDSVVDTINKKYPDQIPVGQLNDFKRSTYSSAYNKAGDKVLDTVEHDVGDVARLNIEKATVGDKVAGIDIGDFNRQYGDIIEARKLLKIAQGRKQVGLIGKLVALGMGSSIGSAIGGPVGGAVGFAISSPVAEGLAGTFARSLAEKGLIDLSLIPAQEVEQAVLRALIPYLREKQPEQQEVQ